MGQLSNLLSKHLVVQSIVLSLISVVSSEHSSGFSSIWGTAVAAIHPGFAECSRWNQPVVGAGEVCGDDGITYSNDMYLECLNRRGAVNVGIRHYGKCSDCQNDNCCIDNNKYVPVCGTDGKTWANQETLTCYNSKNSGNIGIQRPGECQEIDPCNSGTRYHINPVCGSDGFTYQNADQVRCHQKRNCDLKIVSNGGCSPKYVKDIHGSGTGICTIASNRKEYNPVCGSDGKTYSNPFTYLCSNPNGPAYDYNGCTAATTDRCDSINDGYFVCGSDGRSYNGRNHLDCQSKSDRHLYMMHGGRCIESDDPCGRTHKHYPVCGTDGVTYTNPQSIWCTGQRNPDSRVSYFHDGPCLLNSS